MVTVCLGLTASLDCVIKNAEMYVHEFFVDKIFELQIATENKKQKGTKRKSVVNKETPASKDKVGQISTFFCVRPLSVTFSPI